MTAQIECLPVLPGDMFDALAGPWRAALERDLLPPFLATQRWFGAKDQRIASVSLVPLARLDADCALCVVELALSGGVQRYFLPLAVQPRQTGSGVMARVQGGRALVDGAGIPDVAQALLDAMRRQRILSTAQGDLRFEGTDALRRVVAGAPRRLAVDQSNVSLLFGQEIILKIYRRLRPGLQPDVEMGQHLTQAARFAQTPAYLGSVTLHEHGDATTLAAAFGFVPNQGDAWSYLNGLFAQGGVSLETSAELIRCLGQRTGDLHRALTQSSDDPAFAPEAITRADLAAWVAEAQQDLASALDALATGRLDARAQALAQKVFEARDTLNKRLALVADLPPSGQRIRIHGDYHLGQVLVSGDDVAIIDFEGEPRRDLAARRAKAAPLRDVAGMIRSLDYAARSAAEQQATSEQARRLMNAWRRHAVDAYVLAYDAAMKDVASHPDFKLRQALLDLFLVQKAAYEIGYELANRPNWAHLPLAGLLALTKGEGAV